MQTNWWLCFVFLFLIFFAKEREKIPFLKNPILKVMIWDRKGCVGKVVDWKRVKIWVLCIKYKFEYLLVTTSKKAKTIDVLTKVMLLTENSTYASYCAKAILHSLFCLCPGNLFG